MKSRILNVSPRPYLRDLDSKNVLPAIVRTGYQNEIGSKNEPFNDADVLVYTSSQVIAPYMIPSASAGFTTGSLIFTSNIKDSTSYLDKPVVNGVLSPFIEYSNPAGYNLGSEDKGFPQNTYPGFSSPEKDKIAITIDITPSAEKKLTRLSRADSISGSAAGEFYDSTHTGFAYFNFVNKTWDYVGETDPVTGADLNYTSILTSSDARMTSGHRKMMSQFCSTPNVAGSTNPAAGLAPTTVSQQYDRGYDKIGEPTSMFEAPYAPRYHANQNQTIKLSDYIKHPIVVDRFSVELPVKSRRIQNPPVDATWSRDTGFGRDIDNYVVFLYTQNRSNAVKDSITDVSSSIRNLVARKSFCFYNTQTFSSGLQAQPIIHDAAYSASFSMTSTQAKTAGVRQIEEIDANVYMTFRPTTFNQYYGGQSKYGAFRENASSKDNIILQHFWRGGQYASGSTNDSFVRWGSSTYTLNKMAGYEAESGSMNQSLVATVPSQRALISSFWKSSQDTRTDTAWTPDAKISTEISCSVETPIILFPEDELVLGIESGVHPNTAFVNSTGSGLDESLFNVTGSVLTIKQENAKIVIYGSLVQNAKELLPSLNQHLGSAAVSEDIHYNNSVVDQYDVYPRAYYSASYINNIINGSNLPNRRRIGNFTDVNPAQSISRGYLTYANTQFTGSFSRNLKIFDQDVVFYDSMTPAPSAIAAGITSASANLTASYTGSAGSQTLISASVPPSRVRIDRIFVDTDVTVSVFPAVNIDIPVFAIQNIKPGENTYDVGGVSVKFISNDKRYFRNAFAYETSTENTQRSREIELELIRAPLTSLSPIAFGVTSVLGRGDAARALLYYDSSWHPLFNDFEPDIDPPFKFNYGAGAASIRYGLSNIRLTPPTYVFKRDHYGFVRDMLEQSRDSRAQYLVGSKPVVTDSVVIAEFVSASSDIKADPYRTQCNNVSRFCTSSVPYDDGRVRSRGAVPAVTLSIGPNNLIFGVTGSFGFK
jgi:hypothetical protein